MVSAAVALIATILVMVPVAPMAFADAQLALSKSAPGTALSGEPLTFSLRATNPGDAPQYNASFRDVLPLGVTYVPGSTAPVGAGDPTIFINTVQTEPGSGVFVQQQTLIWENVADVQPGDAVGISFSADLNQTPGTGLPVYIVGSSVDNSSEAYASPSPRVLQRFDEDGEPIPEAAGVIDNAVGSSTTTLTAIQIAKAEPSPEGELLRGLHDGLPTTYTLKVSVTEQDDVDDVIVIDYLPAELEFLGCGEIDNTAAGVTEYPGAARLDATTPVPDCVFPDTVQTVEDPPANGSTTYPPGVYTKLTWNLGDLDAGQIVELPYAAGFGMFANELFDDPSPAPPSGEQAANLDNNTGASTRELDSETSVTNVARAAGDFVGVVEAGTSSNVADDDRLSRTIEDVRVRKSVAPGEIAVGEIATYEVVIDASEYTGQVDIVLTDELSNGLCPLDDTQNPSPDGAAECAPSAVFAPTITIGGVALALPYDSVVANPDGGFSVAFSAITALPAQGTAVVTYYARMRSSYEDGVYDQLPVAAGDSFSNAIDAAATSVPIPGGEIGDQAVTDDSSAGLSSDFPTIDKRLFPRELGDDTNLFSPGEPCPTDAAVYLDDTDPALDANDLQFRLGDRLCFLLRVDFSDEAFTRNGTITDFLPLGVEYQDGSMTETAASDVGDMTFGTAPSSDGVTLTWEVGDVVGVDRYVDPGGVFEVVIGGIIAAPSPTDSPLITGNLMKVRTINSEGAANSLRDRVDFEIVPPADLSILKGVQTVDLPAFSTPLPNVDGIEVEEGSTVTYRVDVTNSGTDEGANGFGVLALDIWDVLPDGISCAQISNISNFIDDVNGGPIYGTCTNPGDATHPAFTLGTVRSAIRWIFPADPSDPNGGVVRWRVNDGQTRTLTYQMQIPAPTSAGDRLVNTAYIRSAEGFTNELNGLAKYYPADNIDDTVTPDQENALPASDPSNVFTPGVLLAKSATTGIVETNNNLTSQAVPGELVTYTYSVVIPARTSVFEATLTDQVPSQVGIVAPAPVGRFYPDRDADPAQPLPAGFTLGANGTLTFPTVYDNASNLDVRFEVDVVVRVDNDFGGQPTIVNTAQFRSLDQVGGQPIQTPRASAAVGVRQPSPNVSKSADSDVVVAGEVVQFTLVASNASGRPPLHDAWLVDCLPDGEGFLAFGPGSGLTIGPEPGDGANGCATGTTLIGYLLDTVPGNNVGIARTYTVTVAASAAGEQRYANTVRLSGSSLDDGTADGAGDRPTDLGDPDERTYQAQVTEVIRVPPTGTTKSVEPDRATIGETVVYTVAVAVPIDTNFYQSGVIDQLPPGINPASVQFLDSKCTSVDPSAPPCPLVATPLPTVGGPGADSTISFLVGDIVAQPYTRLVTIRYSARVADVAGNVAAATIRNSAQSVWDLEDNDDVPTDATYPWTVEGDVRIADVAVVEPAPTITKRVSDTTPEPGVLFEYTIEIANPAGEFVSDAYNGRITDVVPAGVDVDPTTISFGGQYDPVTRTITWTSDDLEGPLAPGESIELSYQAVLAPSATIGDAPKVNVANLGAFESLLEGGRVYSGNTSDATVTPDFPQIDTDKSATGGPLAYIGDEYVWAVTAVNTGTGIGYGATIADTLPPNWTYVPASTSIVFPDGTIESREPDLVTFGSTASLTWEALGEIAPTEMIRLTYRAIPTADVITDPGIGIAVPHENQATSTAFDLTGADGNADGPYGGDTVQATTRIAAVDLAIDKSHDDAEPPVAGRSFSWQLEITNQSGTDTAVGPFVVTDTLPTTPPGLSFVGAAGVDWACDEDANVITCVRTDSSETLGPLDSFPVIDVTVFLPADAVEGTVMTNSASIDGRTFDVDTSNNTDDDTTTVNTLADLQIAKNRSLDLRAGTAATYTIDVVNTGPSLSRAPITVVDTLPDGTTFVSGTGTGWACDAIDSVITCVFSSDLLVLGVAPQLVITVDVPSGTIGELENTAVVSGPTTDPDSTNNTALDVGPVTTSANLRLAKQATGPIVAGSPATYRLRVDNDGPSDAAATVLIADSLPAGLTFSSFVSVEGTWDCVATGGGAGVDCALTGSLRAGSAAAVDVTVDVASNVVDTVVNTATVTSPTPDPVPDDNTDADDSPPDVQADLTVDKTSVGTVDAGNQLEWTIEVTNLGPSDSDGPFTVSDPLLDGVALVSAVGTGWTCDETDGLLVCSTDDALPSGSTAEPIAVLVDVAPAAGPATISNVAAVAGPANDPVPDNNDGGDDVIVTDLAELTILKTTTGVDPVRAGENTEFTIEVSNLGPSTADAVVVSDVLPIGLVGLAAVGEGWECTIDDLRVVGCLRPSLDPGPAGPIVITVGVDPGVPNETLITNVATVVTSTTEAGTEPNESSVELLVLALADLSVVKTHAGPARIGSMFSFEIVVSNSGPSSAADVVMTDVVPDGLTPVTAISMDWTCEIVGQTVTCSLANALLPSVTASPITLTTAVGAIAFPSVVNVASVVSITPDPDETNNIDDDPVQVPPQSDLAVAKSHIGTPIVGERISYVLTVANEGPIDESAPITVVDELPASLADAEAASDLASCTVVEAIVTCIADGGLAVGASVSITISATVLPDAYPLLVNTASVASDTDDPNDTNDNASDEAAVPPLVDLNIVKTHLGTPAVGGSLSYQLTVGNGGPTADPGPITIVDELPAGVRATSASGPGLSCTVSPSRVTCVDADGLEVDDSVVVSIVTELTAAAYPEVENTASVRSAAADIDPTNDVGSDLVAVIPSIALTLDKVVVSQNATSVVWGLDVVNTGANETVEPVVLTDRLPAGLVFVSASGTGWSCSSAAASVTCAYTDRVAAGGAAPRLVITTSFVTGVSGQIINTATASGAGPVTPPATDTAAVVAPPAGQVPATGSSTSGPLRLGTFVAGLGLVLLLMARRRRSARTTAV